MYLLPVSYNPKYDAQYGIIPKTETVIPLYKPLIPSDLPTFFTTSRIPVNYRSAAPLPRSAPNLVLAKSKG